MEAWDGAALEGLTLLIITDALDSIKSLIEPLRSAGAVVVAVRAAQLALAYSERHAVDTILVDLRESGWTLTDAPLTAPASMSPEALHPRLSDTRMPSRAGPCTCAISPSPMTTAPPVSILIVLGSSLPSRSVMRKRYQKRFSI
jgi:CheY-like chemotaxis protein